MSLRTPFGPLAQIHLEDLDTLKDILVRSDKSRMLEGLVIEAAFSDYIEELSEQGVTKLPISLVRTLKKKPPRRSRRHRWDAAWWIWDYSGESEAANTLRNRLSPINENDSRVLDCYYDEGSRDFYIKEWNGEQDIQIQPFMMRHRNKEELNFEPPSESVIDKNRSEQAFWSGIFNHYTDELFKKVVLHRLFKNCALQPFFDGLWDIDSLVQLPDQSIIQLEVKHKFPRADGPSRSLSFGINVGQIRVMLELARRGIKTLHIVMVKPKWDKNISSNYLLSRVKGRGNVLLLAKLLDEKSLTEIHNRPSQPTGVEQSFTGREQQNVRYVYPREFQVLGTLDHQAARVAENIKLAAMGALNAPANDQMLHSKQLKT